MQQRTPTAAGYSEAAHQAGTFAPQPSPAARRRLKRQGGQVGTLHELTKLAPVDIIAEALGYSPTTIERHAI